MELTRVSEIVVTTSRCVCPILTRSFPPFIFDHSSRRAARHLRSLYPFYIPDTLLFTHNSTYDGRHHAFPFAQCEP